MAEEAGGAVGTGRSDEELMSAYLAGDREAFQALFRRYTPPLLALFRRGLASASDAEDALQETFLHLHRARLDYRGDARLRPWLMTIALNVRREHQRRRQRKPERPLEPGSREEGRVSPVDVALAERARALRQALLELPEKQRLAIELHYYAGLSFPEVAESLGATVSAAKVWAHRGYERLRQRLKQEEL